LKLDSFFNTAVQDTSNVAFIPEKQAT
jgi:hypothetical protein